MELRSIKTQNIIETQKPNGIDLPADLLTKKFNDGIAKHCYKPNKIALIEKDNGYYKIYYYDVENFDYRIIRDRDNLTHAIFPDGIKRIRSNIFTNCSELVNIYLPESIESIGNNCFSKNTSLIQFSCPKNLISIQKNAFSGCGYLKIFNTNSNLQEILSKAFENCFSLEKINLPNSITKIGEESFAYCTNLKNLTLPEHLQEIPRGCFRYCSSLENVTLPKDLVTIKSRSFESCNSLNSIELPPNVTTIESLAFCNCSNMSSITLSPNIEILEDSTFEGCIDLKKVVLPSNLKTIKSRCFFSNDLKNISFPATLKTIENEAFANCSIRNIELPESLEYVGKEAFIVNTNLSSVTINGNTEFDFGCFDNKMLKYIAYQGNKKILCNKLPKYYDNFIEIPSDANSIFLMNNAINFDYETNKKLLDLYENTGIIFTYKFINNLKNSNLLDDLLKNIKSLKFYSKIFSVLPKNITEKQLYNLEKFCHILGLFETPSTYQTIKGNNYYYDFATCAYNFFHNNFLKNGKFKILDYLDGLNYRDFNSQLAKFLMEKTQRKKSIKEKESLDITPISNFNRILITLKDNKTFLTKICNNFEVLQQYNQKNKGSHKTLAPNVNSYKVLLNDVSYNGVTDENKELAKFLNQISASQKDFDVSIELYNVIRHNNFNHHILSTPLSKTILYEDINKNLTYEWLDKYDYNNLILGLKTSSCASIKNEFGNGIVKANYLYQNVQNLIIRDNNNNIIAKATFYVNGEQGYGVFNTFMMYSEVPKAMNSYIFNCFMQGVKDFAVAYNNEHPNNPLIQINIGKSRNKLDEEFSNNYPLSDFMLNSIDFSSFLGANSYALINDWELNQYVIWNILEEETKIYTQTPKTNDDEKIII